MAKKRKEVKAVAKLTDDEVLAAGHDLACYRQGQSDKADKDPDSTEEVPNPFEEESNAGKSWAAGYAAGPDTVEDVDF